MKNILFVVTSLLLIISSCKNYAADPTPAVLGIIPAPQSIIPGKEWSAIEKIFFPTSLKENSSYAISIAEINKHISSSYSSERMETNVYLSLHPKLQSESYQLRIGMDSIILTAGDEAGVQYALTSLAQLAEFNHGKLPVVTIDDSPRFAYRGMHLDVGRHFFGIGDIKKYLDYMSYYKFNRFHWHLTEDQGWRIEIKKYPKLQEIAAYRKETLIGHYNDVPHQFDGQRYGGFYTQEEVKEIVAYAAARHIEIIPEIEMPGHCQAALSAYPELGCGPGPYEAATLWGVFDDVYCPTEASFTFLEDVIDEIIALFPSQYIHIGGDECPKTAWKKSAFCQQLIHEKGLKDEHGLQSYFIMRMEKYINSKGKKIIGWDEILEGGLAPNATVMSWRGIVGGVAAAQMGHDVIMTPTDYCYFDYYQTDDPAEPLAIGGFLPLNKVYDWQPIPAELDSTHRKFIIGGQANLWTEYIPDYPSIEYMVYARGMAMAEVLWNEQKDYPDFINRIQLHIEKWKASGANIANHILDLTPRITSGKKGVSVSFAIPSGAETSCSFDNKPLTAGKDGAFPISHSGTYSFFAQNGSLEGRPLILNFNLHKGTGATILMDQLPDQKYAGNGPGSIINGVTGSDEKYGGTEWLGFNGNDCAATLDFGREITLNRVAFRFFKGEGQWIYLPARIELFVSSDGVRYVPLKTVSTIASNTKTCTVTIPFDPIQTKYLKWHVYNFGTIPDGQQGAGHKAWLFMDEVVIE